MTIKEAIEDIISRKDDSLLIDLKKFMSYLRDLIPEHHKELNILQNGLTERILKLFFDDDRPPKNRIALIKMELEDQGLSKKWVNFILDSFCSALGWEIENKDDDNDKVIKNKVTENNFTVNKEVDLEEAKRQVEEAKKQLELAQKKELENSIKNKKQEIRETENNLKEAERKIISLKFDLEESENKEKELQEKYDNITNEKSETEKDIAETKARFEKLKLKLEQGETEYIEISDDLDEIQLKTKNLKSKYDEAVKKSYEAKEILKKMELEELILKANCGDPEAQNDLGDKYYVGNGVAEDESEAIKWYRKSAEQGNEFAKKSLERLELKNESQNSDDDWDDW